MNKIQFENHNGMLPPKGAKENDEFHENLYKSMDLEGMLLKCPECDRLIWRKPGSEEFSSYIKE